MSKRNQWRFPMLAVSLGLCLPLLAHAQAPAATTLQPTGKEEPAGKPRARNMAELKLGPIPGMPTCLSGAVESGDPMTGPGVILAKLAAGCTIPWHWHTASEHVMLVSGTGRIDMVDAESRTLTAGGFARLPSFHIHQFICEKKCTLFIYTDAAFDIHYANKEGNEIPAEDALKPFKEKPAPKM